MTSPDSTSNGCSRFNAILTLTHNAARLLAVVLGLAVLLVVGNTIRLEIQNRCSEVQVMDLVGATPAFIRRPFLYSGAWHGRRHRRLAMVSLSTQLLQGPVGPATLYHTEFALAGLDLRSTLVLLGWASPWNNWQPGWRSPST